MLDQIRSILERVLNGNSGTVLITRETNIFSDLGMQSLSVIVLISLCEAEFGVELASKIESVDQISTVGDLISFIRTAGEIAQE